MAFGVADFYDGKETFGPKQTEDKGELKNVFFSQSLPSESSIEGKEVFITHGDKSSGIWSKLEIDDEGDITTHFDEHESKVFAEATYQLKSADTLYSINPLNVKIKNKVVTIHATYLQKSVKPSLKPLMSEVIKGEGDSDDWFVGKYTPYSDGTWGTYIAKTGWVVVTLPNHDMFEVDKYYVFL